MLSIQIDNPEIEQEFKEYAAKEKKSLKEVTREAMRFFLDTRRKEDGLIYEKKNPMQHIQNIDYEDDGEDLSDVKLFSHVEDAAKYVHDLRRKKAK